MGDRANTSMTQRYLINALVVALFIFGMLVGEEVVSRYQTVIR